MVETLRTGTYTRDGQHYLSETCLFHVFVMLGPHDGCPGGQGTLIVPLQPGDNTHNVGYSCNLCGAIVFQHAQGICL